jgi:hypothetical protein
LIASANDLVVHDQLIKGGRVKKIINLWKASVAWAKSVHRDAALDSLRNVLAVVGAATILADFDTIKVWLILPMLAFAFLIWFLDYERHFHGQNVEEATAPR